MKNMLISALWTLYLHACWQTYGSPLWEASALHALVVVLLITLFAYGMRVDKKD